MIRVTAFKWVPPFAQGLVRDLRVRWALEEAGIPYEARLIDPQIQQSAAYRALQPFGQVPVLEDEDAGITLFESGAILLYIGQRSEQLLPKDAESRARATTWVFASLNSVETFVQNYVALDLFYADEEWARLRRPSAGEAVRSRLSQLSTYLQGRDYLEDRFSAGDLMMTTVLRILRHTDLVTGDPVLNAYVERCEARPAFGRALKAQMEPFANGPA